MKLSTAATILNGTLIGEDAEFNSISTDSRKVNAGDLFFALIGPNFNGHDFINQAQQQHAIAAVVSQHVDTTLPLIKVNDTSQALGQLAAYHRQQFSIPVIGITGSCGKTTTKTMLANILQLQGKALAPEGTFNNAYGVPITLLKLNAEHRYAVIEMGTNQWGEINYLAQMAKPTIAFITNAAAVHLAAFGEVAGVAREKGDIYKALPTTGTAIINADDEFADYWQSSLSGQTILRFGINSPANITAKNSVLNENGKATFVLVTPTDAIEINLPELGLHNINNALAAAAAAFALTIPIAIIKQGLESTPPVSKRLIERKGVNGAQLIDDTYNSAPPSFIAALSVLANKKGEKIVVMGDMLELGARAEAYHRDLGLEAKRLGINQLYTFGKLSKLSSEAFGNRSRHFNEVNELISVMQGILDKDVVVLIKGSRGMKMERVVEALLEN